MSVTKRSEQTGKHLLEHYQVGDYFLASPGQTLKGSGVFTTVDWEVGEFKSLSLAEQVQTTLRRAREGGHSHPVVIGAIPFDPKAKPHLVVPKEVQMKEKIDWTDVGEEEQPPVAYHIHPVPNPETYMTGVQNGLDRIAKGELDKIVLSRSLHITSEQPIQVKPILTNLAKHNSKGYTFALDLEAEQHDRHRTLIGASPELLVSKSGSVVTANPLAGSRPRSEDPVEDERRAAELLQSSKDLHEHAVVVEAVKEAIEPLCKELDVPSEPSLIKTEAMWHLSTEINGVVGEEDTSSLDLAEALHPTPAVCGHPTEKAREAIQTIEPFDRKFFTGMVGWCDEQGDGEWIVTIRCAEVTDQAIKLFAGAGVVAGSKPEEELAETGAKFQTMLNAMGIREERS
ncbi:isochorismate synthase DhbC [Pontibacillus sp. ALD_SL1]|uniref:isochorismate synthase DhbC n=1 Tax=Pontibacillus sp. ALD_SL1 TaxID=2777185 RepID=UPI001A975687|nr:isochorismate synthase DhbC [Pontibacillus sp. ALD_SL1]QST01041.1 isochorismate synthase DhbC [Pontibacillus sp. ALD_SL1]